MVRALCVSKSNLGQGHGVLTAWKKAFTQVTSEAQLNKRIEAAKSKIRTASAYYSDGRCDPHNRDTALRYAFCVF